MNRARDMDRIFLWIVLVGIFSSLGVELISFADHSKVASLLTSQVVLALPLVIYIIRYRINILELLRIRKVRIVNVVLLVIFSYFVTPALNLLNQISMLFATNVINPTVTSIITNHSFIVSLLVIALVPCILEESIYRGAFLSEYSKVNGMQGIFLSALLFGLMHLNLNQFVYAFAIGIVFSLLVEGTGSVVSSMIVHFMINGTSVISAYLEPIMKKNAILKYGAELANEMYPDLTKLNQAELKLVLKENIISGIFPAVITVLVGVFVFLLIVKNAGRLEYLKNIFKKSSVKTEKKDTRRTAYFWAGIGLCVFLIVWMELSINLVV